MGSPVSSNLIFVNSVVTTFVTAGGRTALPLLTVNLPTLRKTLATGDTLRSPPSAPAGPEGVALRLIYTKVLKLTFKITLVNERAIFKLLLN